MSTFVSRDASPHDLDLACLLIIINSGSPHHVGPLTCTDRKREIVDKVTAFSGRCTIVWAPRHLHVVDLQPRVCMCVSSGGRHVLSLDLVQIELIAYSVRQGVCPWVCVGAIHATMGIITPLKTHERALRSLANFVKPREVGPWRADTLTVVEPPRTPGGPLARGQAAAALHVVCGAHKRTFDNCIIAFAFRLSSRTK
jgi:hypothetical protein